jgi:hypothetical protein
LVWINVAVENLKKEKPQPKLQTPDAQKDQIKPAPAESMPPNPPSDTAKDVTKEAKALLDSQGEKEMAAKVKEMESAFFAVKFYPVAVNEDNKDEALQKLEKIYNDGSETARQLLLYMVHDNLCQSAELRVLHTYDYFKAKNPAQDPGQLRMNVYRSMFNYHTSLEGLVEFIRLLGRLRGGDDAAKLLTYHFSHMSSQENAAHHMLRAAIIEALGKSESGYALKALLDYARYDDNEQMFQRVVTALSEWDGKIDSLKLTTKEKEHLRLKLTDVMTRQVGGETHYR